MTDSLRLQGEGKYIPQRWYDQITQTDKEQEVDDRPSAEIVADIWARAGITEREK